MMRACRPIATALIALLALSLAGCAVGPNYQRPAIPTPPQFRSNDPLQGDGSIAQMKWPDLFADPALTGLVTTALQNNFDLNIAAERVIQARENAGIQGSFLYPTLSASASFTGLRASQNGATKLPPAIPSSGSYTQAGLNLSWELDVWGRIRRLKEAARAEYLASEEGRRAVQTMLVAEVTQDYLSLRELDMELQIAYQTREIAADGLRLTLVRRNRGAATGLDVHQSEQFLYTATAQIASVERQISQTENELSLLLGRDPGDVPRGKTLEELTVPAKVPAGLPSELLERRPDIREAEQQLIAANAEIGAAKAEYFPQITLTGFLGGQSRSLTELFTGPARFWSGGPSAAAPLFNAGRIRAGVRITESEQRAALLAYQKAIETAFREVSDSLIGYQKTAEQRQQQALLVDALRESDRLSNLRYRGGLDSYLQVLDSERNLFQGELALAQLQRNELQSIVQLYRALGGGWQ
jgi:multidrug efflux system outer membrane protein